MMQAKLCSLQSLKESAKTRGCRLAWSRLVDLGKDTYGFLDFPYRDVDLHYHCIQQLVSGSGGLSGVNVFNWRCFRDWLLSKELSKAHVRNLVSYARRFSGAFFEGRFAEIERAGKSKHGVLSALSQLSRYLGCYSYFKRLKEESGLKWHDNSTEEIFANIWGQEVQGIVEWLNLCREKLSYRDWFPLEWIALSGIRKGEGYNSLDIIRIKGLEGYLNNDVGVLEHFRYGKTFLRRSKKLYVSILDDKLIEDLGKWKKRSTSHMLRKQLLKYGLETRVGDLRKNWGTYMVMNGLPEQIVDLCQGRVGKSIFTAYYFRPDVETLVSQVRRKLQDYRKKTGLV
jgi:hypothetical protein